MSVLNEDQLLGAPSASYQIQRSLRFNSADSAYLSRTPASAGNRKTWTWSGWVKRSVLGTGQFFSAGPLQASGNATGLVSVQFGGDSLQFTCWTTNSTNVGIKTTAVYMDPSAWYHIVAVLDTDNATASDRVQLYVNGVRVTAFSAATYPTLGATFSASNTEAHNIGRYVWSADQYFSGYLADIHFIDGQALTPASFGQTDATTGEWVPIAYTGTYGTNGFKLDYADNSAATAAALGKDTSGNGNNWTPNNLSVTAGAGNDSLVDTPTSYGTDTGVGGEVRGNYCTLNPLDKGSSITLSNGNLDYAGGASSNTVRATFQPKSGKWYWEASGDANTIIGISASSDSLSVYPGDAGTSGRGYNGSNGTSIIGGGVSATWATFTSTDVIGLALDVDAGTCAVYKNNSLQGTWTGLVNPVPAIGRTTGVASVNFGQRPFAYTAPSGFKALCDTNLPAPTIVKPSTVMDVKLYTGNDSTQSITGLGFSPDFAWIKTRSNASSHQLFDVVRGVGKALQSNSTNAEATNDPYGYLSAFNSDGFTVAAGGSGADYVNKSTWTYAAWCWDAGSSTVTNTAGTIQSSVRANASAGFSVVSWTAPASGAYTVGHGLGVVPQFIITKGRSFANNFLIQSPLIGVSANNYLALNLTQGTANYPTNGGIWNGTNSTSSVFSMGADFSGSATWVAYCFAPVAGYSAFGSYTGNGSADGPFVYTGFRPRWVMVKASSTTSDWIIYDTARDAYNVMGKALYPSLSNAEVDSPPRIDFLSNGFKLRVGGASEPNWSAATVIYAAFAEFPFQYARAR